MGLPKDFHKLDLYGILGIAEDSDEKQIAKAYRKKALKCHPDKNPDKRKAAEEFHKVSLALEILTDLTARAAYDQVIRSKRAANKRHRDLDNKRKKFKEDLDARERAANEERLKDTELDNEARLQREIARLRKEGSRLLEEQQRWVEEELKREAKSRTEYSQRENAITPKIKVTWNGKTDTNGGYTEDLLSETFSKYGDVSNVLMSSKNGRALIELSSLHSMNITNEIGLTDNPFKVRWLEGGSKQTSNIDSTSTQSTSTQSTSTQSTSDSTQTDSTNTSESSRPNSSDDFSPNRDFETLVMRKLRQAEERRKLIEQITKQDEEEA